MADAGISTKEGVKALLDGWSEAIRAKDIDWLMSHYASDAVYFDLVPPLQIVGTDGIRKNFLRWFGGWSSVIGQDVGELTIQESGDIAVAFMLIRASGTLKDGRAVGYWVRASVCCRRSDGGWLIIHEHISLPVDFRSGRAVMDLVPSA
jgi:ketosteroid isomerase-like protein